DTIRYDKTAGCYKCQLDEQWFDLTKDTLRDAIQITPIKNNRAFSSPPSSDALINFVNELGYPKLVRNLSNVFHSRPDSLLHLPNEEPVLGYLKFSAKGTNRKVFGMPIPGNLITTDIQGESYYREYLEKVAKHQRYLAGETGSDPDSPAPKPTKTTKKSKPTAPKAALGYQSQNRPHLNKLNPNLHRPRLKKKSRTLEESLKSIYDVPRGPLPSMIIREPEFGKYQPLPEVQGKGKEKVIKEQVARNLLTLQTPKQKRPADQYIFQRRTSTPIGSSSHDESSSLYVELVLTDSEVESDKDCRGLMREFKARLNPGDAAASQPLPSLVVHAGPNLEHMGFEVQENLKLTVEGHVILEEPASSTETLSSLQHLTKDFSFGELFFNDKPSKVDIKKTTAETEVESMVYVTIQLDTSAILSMTTSVVDLTSRPESLNVQRPLQAMRIGELKHIMANLIQENKHLEERLDSHGARLYTLVNLDIPHHVSKAIDKIVTDAVNWAIQAPLRNRFRDLPEADMKEILHQRMWETNSYKTREDHKMLYEALEKSMNHNHSEELAKDLAEARKKKKKRRDSPKTPPGSPPHQPPPPSPPAGPSGASGSLKLLDPHKCRHHRLHLYPPNKKVSHRA
nr:histone deacetylase 14 [Tanacetum cinerariifolium]